MLNAEKYREEILENSNVVSDFSMSKDKHTIKKCLGVCKDCFFYDMGDHCSNIKVKWLLSEYKEFVITKLEYEILKYAKKEGFHYIVRNENGLLVVHEARPTLPTKYVGWCSCGKSFSLYGFEGLFQFVKWKNEKPTSIEYVLENCEVVESDL